MPPIFFIIFKFFRDFLHFDFVYRIGALIMSSMKTNNNTNTPELINISLTPEMLTDIASYIYELKLDTPEGTGKRKQLERIDNFFDGVVLDLCKLEQEVK